MPVWCGVWEMSASVRCIQTAAPSDRQAGGQAGWRQRPHTCHSTPHAKGLHSAIPTRVCTKTAQSQHHAPAVTAMWTIPAGTKVQQAGGGQGGWGVRPGRWGRGEKRVRPGMESQNKPGNKKTICVTISKLSRWLTTTQWETLVRNEIIVRLLV